MATDRFNGVVASKAIKVRCVVGAEANVATLENEQTIEGISVFAGDRVLLTAQTDPIENGAWDVVSGGPWTRSADWDGNRDVEKGSTVWAGALGQDDKLWQVQTSGTILPGTTSVSITELFNPAAPSAASLADVTSIGDDTLGNNIVISSANPLLTLQDDNNTGASATGNVVFIDSAAAEQASVRLLSSDIVIDSVNGNVDLVADNGVVRVAAPTAGYMEFSHDDTHGQINDTVGNGIRLQVSGSAQFVVSNIAHISTVPLKIQELGAAAADTAGYGQFWVDSADSLPYFTDDGGNIYPLTGGGAGGTGSIVWTYDNTVTGAADPGAGMVRLNQLNPVSVGAMFVNDADVDGLDIQNIISTLPAGGSHVVLRNTEDNTQYRVYAITSIADNVGWYQINLDYLFGNGDASITDGIDLTFEFFSSPNVEGGVDVGNMSDLLYWEGSTNRWEASGSLLRVNPNSPPLGGRIQLGTTSGFSTTSPQIMRPLGAADTIMDYVYGTDANNGFFQGYRRSTTPDEMIFGARIASVNTDLLLFTLDSQVVVEPAAAFMIGERATQATVKTGYGEFWVRNDTNQTPMFTDEAGVDYELNAAGRVVTDINTATPPTTELVTGNFEIYDLEGVDLLATYGFNGSNELQIINEMYGAADTSIIHMGFGQVTALIGMQLTAEGSLFLTSNSTATGGIAPNDDQIITMRNRNNNQTFMELGVYGTGDVLKLRNGMSQQPIAFEVKRGSLVSSITPGLLINPTGNVADDYDGQLGTVISYYMEASVSPFPATRTMPVASGVFQVNTDGAGTWERVLTLSDLGGGASQLDELSDVVSATNTNRFALVANGTTGYVGRALVEADISDLGTYLTDITGETLSDLSDIPAEPTGGSSNYFLNYNDTGDTFSWVAQNDAFNYAIGTSAGTVAEGNHTHLLAAGATDVTATAAELNLLDLSGLTVGWVLSADSATTASWKAPTGGGNVSNTGTPLNNQLAIFTDATTIEGDPDITYDGTTFLVIGGFQIQHSTGDNVNFAHDGNDLNVTSAATASITFVDVDVRVDDAVAVEFGTSADATLSYDGTDTLELNLIADDIFEVQEAGAAKFQISHFSNWVSVNDGYELYVRSADDLEWIVFDHDGADGHIGTGGAAPGSILCDSAMAWESATDTVSANAVTLTIEDGNAFEVDLEPATATVAVTLSGGPPTGRYYACSVKVQQDGVTAQTLTWAGGTFVWRDGTAHVMNSTLDGISIYTFETWDGGTTWYASGADYS